MTADNQASGQSAKLRYSICCERIWADYASGHIADSAEMARRLYPLMQSDLNGAMRFSRNGRRLLEHPELRADVAYCMQREIHQLVAVMQPDGLVTKLSDEPAQ